MLSLRDTSPLLALMSGSGSTIFAVYRDEESAMRARALIDFMHGDGIIHLTNTLSSFPGTRSA